MSEEQQQDTWMREFQRALVESGMPARQVMRYEHEYLQDAMRYFNDGVAPGDAAAMELIG